MQTCKWVWAEIEFYFRSSQTFITIFSRSLTRRFPSHIINFISTLPPFPVVLETSMIFWPVSNSDNNQLSLNVFIAREFFCENVSSENWTLKNKWHNSEWITNNAALICLHIFMEKYPPLWRHLSVSILYCNTFHRFILFLRFDSPKKNCMKNGCEHLSCAVIKYNLQYHFEIKKRVSKEEQKRMCMVHCIYCTITTWVTHTEWSVS